MDYSPPGSSAYGISQAWILEWVAISFSRDLPDPGIEPVSLSSPALAGGFFILRHLGSPEQFLAFSKYSYMCLEKALAPHSSTPAWKIPWTEEPGGLQSMGSRRVRHDWATSPSLCPFMHWRRKWQPTPVILPGESQGRRSLVGCCLWGRTESDTTEVT